MTDQIIIDLSKDNVGESIYDKNHVYIRTDIHDFDWSKSVAKGVIGAICKSIEGDYNDPAYDRLMNTSPLSYMGSYGFLAYSRQLYPYGKEEWWGRKQGQRLLERNSKHPNASLKVAIDFEQTARYEPLNYLPTTNFSMNRALKIMMFMGIEIERLAGYYPILYTNGYNTKQAYNFTKYPLWISYPTTGLPIFYNWKDYDLHQFTWTAPGPEYGNFWCNHCIDLSKVKHIDNLVVNVPISSGSPIIISDPVPVPLFRIQILVGGLRKRSSPEIIDTNIIGYVPYLGQYSVYEINGPWYRIDPYQQIWCSSLPNYVKKI